MLFTINTILYASVTSIAIFFYILFFVFIRRDTFFSSPATFIWDLFAGGAGIAIGWPIIGIYIFCKYVFEKFLNTN